MPADEITDAASPADDDYVEIVVTHGKKSYTFHMPSQATVEDIVLLCEIELQGQAADGEPATHYTVTRLIAPPPVGLINVTKDGNNVLSDYIARLAAAGRRSTKKQQQQQQQPPNQLKLILMATPSSAIRNVREASEEARRRISRMSLLRQRAVPAKRTARQGVQTVSGASSYTFSDIKPLPHLPDPDRSLAYLHRLRDDPGIRHVMQTHQFRVGLLTEMDPRLYTEANHEGTSRTLGLNRNHGQVIELRLRTDDFTGYRDYKTVRKTLCHELAHNVHGPHDKHFWALYRELEREVERVADSRGGRAGGRTLAGGRDGDFYEPPTASSDDDQEHDHVDAGGLIGGTFVLGGAESSDLGTSTATTTGPVNGIAVPPAMGDRERRAHAAEARLRRGTAGEGGAAGNDTTGNDGSGQSARQ
ncbi:hypothetical protein HMPREF1624_08015 [Sporothrix schenckii ATCC 58251]|uniref:WLM domain-containing protein n=1 Tax=Sporothrix schenckii (strain ATCC 58251 / de Perez 2211183) TaxID=1391915 RepID=U7PLA5_SPOS1|nr:hypothetical protein HMPREF1624_08015 [Sporothrix schenckii ATCC 58251]